MTLNVIPIVMRALHGETQEWHVLRLESWYSVGCDSERLEYLHEDFVDEPYWVDLLDYDSFEGVIQ